MSTITAAAVASLRARTGVSMMACKEALEEAGGDEEKAIELLRKRGISQAAKKAARDQMEGLVFLKEQDKKVAAVLLRCETDFVARDDGFTKAGTLLVDTLLSGGKEAAAKKAEEILPELVQKLGENITVGEMHLVESPVIGAYLHSNAKIGVIVGLSAGTRDQARDAAMHAAALGPQYVRPDDVTAESVAKEKEIWSEQLKKEGKPEAMFDKIMIGKEKKFREENALLTQPFVKDPSKTVAQYLAPADVSAYVRLSVA
jgi:elongation factor Ts